MPFVCGQTTAAKCEADPRSDSCAHCLIDKTCDDINKGSCDASCK